jgi:4-hydroxybenzoate polyprenyltransferase
MPYLQLMRPAQWSKNVFLFAGVAFGQKLDDPRSVLWALLGFVCFSLASSAVYVYNDIHDRAEDRHHPVKRNRPIASGRVSVTSASAFAMILLTVALAGGYGLDRGFFLVQLTYVFLQFCYTTWLKHVAVVDVILIGTGFVLRAVAGAVLVHVVISHWLVVCTFTLCLFMGFSKRRCELTDLALDGTDDASRHRKTLAAYTPELLNHMTTLTAGIAVVSFMLYATDKRTLSVFGTNYLIYTLPLVVYAVFRFALLVEHGRVSGPTAVLLRDRPFQIALGLWGLAALVIVYRGRQIQDWLTVLSSPGEGGG